MLLSIVIPCLNEQETIEKVIADAHHYGSLHFKGDYELIVADNGSTDGTLDILKKYSSNVKVVNVPVRGYGAALHWGIMSAQGEYVIFGDADMSYPFSNLPKYKAAMDGSPDMILGSRLKGNIEPGAMPLLNRYMGTPILTFLIRLIYGIQTTDCNSGMRMVRRSFYAKLGMRYSGMEWASELLVRTAIAKGKFKEITIDFKKDQRNRPPHLRRWADGWRHLKSIMFLKPSSLYPFILLFPLLAGICYYSEKFEFTYLFLTLTMILGLSVLALKLMNSTLDQVTSKTLRILSKFEIVPLCIVLIVLILIGMAVLPNERMGTKLLLADAVGVILMWLFLVETIKTHLLHRLPETTRKDKSE